MAHGFLPLTHESKDVVLAATFNEAGTQLATASADHKLRVYTLDNPSPTPPLSAPSPAAVPAGAPSAPWTLLDHWRAHHGAVHAACYGTALSGPLLASLGADLRLKLWREDPAAPPRSGRRFACLYAQSAARGVAYAALAFAPPPPPGGARDAVLALATRDGLVSLLEPCGAPGAADGAADSAAGADDWAEMDRFWAGPAEGPVERGRETAFRVAFQGGAAGPSYGAVAAGVSPAALTLAVASLDVVRVFRVCGAGVGGEGGYRVQAPVAELTGARGLVRDVGWAVRPWAEREWLASAGADGWVRVYEVWAVRGREGEAEESRAERGGAVGRARPQSGIGAGLAGQSRGTGMGEDVLEPGQVPHEWKLVAELRHEGVWRVDWIQGGAMLVSAGDSGQAHVWSQGQDGKWLEFAGFGPKS